MTTTLIDAIPTNRIRTELKIGKTSFYETIRKLGVIPFRSEHDNKTSMVSATDAQKIRDHYHNKTMTLDGSITTLSLAELEERTNPRTDIQNALMPALEIISRLVPAAAAPDPFSTHRTLQDACDHNWQIPTHQLAQLLGRSPKSIQGFQAFDQLGFKFVSHGKGKYRAWEVQKIDRKTGIQAPSF
jgi:hypothetical protein